jgi:hypothetical protein
MTWHSAEKYRLIWAPAAIIPSALVSFNIYLLVGSYIATSPSFTSMLPQALVRRGSALTLLTVDTSLPLLIRELYFNIIGTLTRHTFLLLR